jgi:hypothetical protein
MNTRTISQPLNQVNVIESRSPMAMKPQVKREDLRCSAVYEYLIRQCLNRTVNTQKDVTQVWGLDPEDVERLGIVSCPPEATNLIAAGAVVEKFGESILHDVDGFYKCGSCWWLDLDPRLARRGFIIPVRHWYWSNLITDLEVFPHVRARPFLLKTRAERIAA